MIKSGFEKFQEQCRYGKYIYKTDTEVGDCRCIIKLFTLVCTHEDNEFEQDGEKYVRKCRLYRCPFYNEKEKNYDYGIFMDRVMSYSMWLKEHGEEKDYAMYHIYENYLNQNNDCKIDLSDKAKSFDTELKEFYKRNWTLLKNKEDK